MNKGILIWLDDGRDPHEDNWLVFSPIAHTEVVWVVSYDEFTAWINKNGLPDGICFDHDLGYSWPDIKNKTIKKMLLALPDIETEQGMFNPYVILEKSGMDCAKFVVEYCLDYNLPLPKYNIQSGNTRGKANIDGLFKSFLKSR